MNYLQNLPRTTIKISREPNYLGSGVLIRINNMYYVLTAAHVIYGDDFCDIDHANPSDFVYDSECYGILDYKETIGSKKIHRKNDLLVIRVESNTILTGYPEIKFCDDVSFPKASFIFRGTAKSVSGQIYSINPCYVNSLPDEKNRFCLAVPLDSYSDTKGETGAEVLQGYSGSGLFAKDSGEFLLVGVVLSVSDDNFSGVNCISITALKEDFFPELVLADFHGGNKQFKLNIAELKREITQQLIDQRKGDSYGDVENLTRKMDVFIEGWEPSELDEFIGDILLWDNIEHKRIRNNSEYRDLIDEAKIILASGNKYFRVADIQQGNEKFHKIQEKFVEIVNQQLEGTPLQKYSPTIAAGEIARLLANCKLNFKMDVKK